LRLISEIGIETVQWHLKNTGSAVDLPYKPSEYEAFRVVLDADDIGKIVLWWENEKATKELNCRLVDSTHAAGDEVRVNRFIIGDPKKCLLPADLRTLPNKEPVAVTDDLTGNFLYLIDGSHRTIAQHRSGKSFQDVPIFICVHPMIMRWENIPNFYRISRRNV
jgi:hypothetical protein